MSPGYLIEVDAIAVIDEAIRSQRRHNATHVLIRNEPFIWPRGIRARAHRPVIRRRISKPGCLASLPCRRGCPESRYPGNAACRSAGFRVWQRFGSKVSLRQNGVGPEKTVLTPVCRRDTDIDCDSQGVLS